MDSTLVMFSLMTAVLWFVFASFNALKNADHTNGCCNTTPPSCGDSARDNMVWYATLAMAIMGTLYVVWDSYALYSGGTRSASFVRKSGLM